MFTTTLKKHWFCGFFIDSGSSVELVSLETRTLFDTSELHHMLNHNLFQAENNYLIPYFTNGTDTNQEYKISIFNVKTGSSAAQIMQHSR